MATEPRHSEPTRDLKSPKAEIKGPMKEGPHAFQSVSDKGGNYDIDGVSLEKDVGVVVGSDQTWSGDLKAFMRRQMRKFGLIN